MESPALMLSLVFCALLVAGLITRTVLASRQIRHVARHRATVPAAFAQTITPEAHQKAADYTITKARFGLLDTALEAAMLLGWTLLGGLDWLNQTLLAALGGGMVQQLTLLAAFSLIGGLIGLPLAWWSTFRIEERFGFNKMTLSLWLGDLLKGALVGALVGLPIAALVLWLMGAAGVSWWVWAWGVWMAFNLLALVLYPTLIAPLFNKFEPLQDETLKTRVNALMQRCGFAAKGLFVMDGSKRSAHANAYFTGFGSAKRVVFFDTLLQQLNPAEIDAEPGRVALEGVFLRAAVEQQRVAHVAALDSDQAGEAMDAAAEAAVRRGAQSPPRGEGPFVLDVERSRGEAIDRVVDQLPQGFAGSAAQLLRRRVWIGA